jgi:hypothetical protein
VHQSQPSTLLFHFRTEDDWVADLRIVEIYVHFVFREDAGENKILYGGCKAYIITEHCQGFHWKINDAFRIIVREYIMRVVLNIDLSRLLFLFNAEQQMISCSTKEISSPDKHNKTKIKSTSTQKNIKRTL